MRAWLSRLLGEEEEEWYKEEDQKRKPATDLETRTGQDVTSVRLVLLRLDLRAPPSNINGDAVERGMGQQLIQVTWRPLRSALMCREHRGLGRTSEFLRQGCTSVGTRRQGILVQRALHSRGCVLGDLRIPCRNPLWPPTSLPWTMAIFWRVPFGGTFLSKYARTSSTSYTQPSISPNKSGISTL